MATHGTIGLEVPVERGTAEIRNLNGVARKTRSVPFGNFELLSFAKQLHVFSVGLVLKRERLFDAVELNQA